MAGDEMIIYGGFSPKCLDYCNDIWSWRPSAIGWNKWTRIIADDSEKSWYHGAFLSNDGNYMYTIAGHQYDAYSNEIMQFNLNTHVWKKMNNSINAKLPISRLGHATSARFDNSTFYPHASKNNIAYLHGGYHSDYTQITDTYFMRYMWSLEIDEESESVTWTNLTYDWLIETGPIDEILTEWKRWNAVPFPRMDHQMMHVPNTNFILLFGGYSSNKWFNDIWRFDLNSHKWLIHNPPFFYNQSNISARSGHQWTYLPSTHSILMFGGHGNDNRELRVSEHVNYFDETLILNLHGCKGYDEGNPCHVNDGHGECLVQFCICNDDYWGIGCENVMCPDSECVYDADTLLPDCTLCGGHGICGAGGNCTCFDGYSGEGCMDLNCTNNCNDRGVCTEIAPLDVQCVCDPGFGDFDCGLYTCNNNCTNRGVCDVTTGICACETPQETGRRFSEPDCAMTELVSAADNRIGVCFKIIIVFVINAFCEYF